MKTHYQICSKTVIDSTIPDVTFDENGISNIYWDYENNVKPNWFPNEDGKKYLEGIVRKIQKQNKKNEY